MWSFSAGYLLLVLTASISGLAWSKRLREEIYQPLQVFTFCFKRANGTHQMGCSAELHGNVGVVHLVNQQSDVDWLLSTAPHGLYIPVVSPRMFRFDIMARFQQSAKVNGVVLLKYNQSDAMLLRPDAYSDDHVCPNSESSLYSDPSQPSFCTAQNAPWNPSGNNMFKHDWKFPIFMIENYETINFLINDCFNKFNLPTNGYTNWPLCAIELKAHMHLAMNTPTCLRRNGQNFLSPTLICDKMGDNNVFMLHPPQPQLPSPNGFRNNSVIVLTTALDTVTLFDSREWGADSPVTGIVTLLATADALTTLLTPDHFAGSEVDQILFAFLNGESFDYIGSSRMVYDMTAGDFPKKVNDSLGSNQWPRMRIDALRMVLELGQLHDINGHFVHVDTEFIEASIKTQLKNAAKNYGVSLNDASNPQKGLPPSSLHSVLKAKRSVPGLLLTNFDQQIADPYYHSIYDNFTTLSYDYHLGTDQPLVKTLAKISSMTSHFVYKHVTGAEPPEGRVRVNDTLINELLLCFLVTAQCDLFRVASTPDTPPQNGREPPSLPYPQYVGVDKSSGYHGIMVHRLLAYLTGSVVAVPGHFVADNCTAPNDQNFIDYLYFRGTSQDEVPSGSGVCYMTSAWLAEAISPAFLISNYNFSDPTYSAWSESVWKSVSGRIFLKASPQLERGFLACGVVVCLISLGLTYWTKKHACSLFGMEQDRLQLEPAAL